MGSWETQSSTCSLQEMASPRTQGGQRWRPRASSATVGAIRCPRGIMGNSCDSILTTMMMPPGLSNAFQHRWEPMPRCQSPGDLEIGGTIRHQAISLEILPSHQNFMWPCGTDTRNALPCCFAPLDLYYPTGHMGSLSLTSCLRCLPLCEKMGDRG